MPRLWSPRGPAGHARRPVIDIGLRLGIVLVVAVTALAPGVARAQVPADPASPRDVAVMTTPDTAEPGGARRALAVAAAVVPGALVHGSGHFVLGDRSTARRLLLTELVGAGFLAVGGAALHFSGSDENLALLYVPALFVGGTTVLGSFLSDVVGVAAPAPTGGDRAVPPGRPGAGAVAAARLGYRFAYHPNLDVGHALRVEAGLDLAGFRASVLVERDASGLFAAERLVLAYRTPWPLAGASEVALGVDGSRYRLARDGVSSLPAAAWAELLWDLTGFVPRLPGGYARMRMGVGAEWVAYDAAATAPADVMPLLVAEAGLGARFGPLTVEIGYDHRKDGLPGGVHLRRWAGMLGSLGLAARLRVNDGWAITGAARAGTGALAWTAIERSFR